MSKQAGTKLMAIVLIAILGTGIGTGIGVHQITYANDQANYNQLLAKYDSLNSSYSSDLTQIGHLELIYSSLNSSYSSLLAQYGHLALVYGLLSNNYDSLNVTYWQLVQNYKQFQDDFSQLQAEYITLQTDYNALQIKFSALNGTYLTLQAEYNTLLTDYNALQIELNALNVAYSTLETAYTNLQNEYNTLYSNWVQLTTWVKEQTLPVQYFIFAEACRRYYFEPMVEANSWIGYANFTRMIVLHDASVYDYFTNVDNALSDALIYGSNTMALAYNIFYWVYYPWLPNWSGYGLTGDNLTRINTVHQWCVDHISYEYDSAITTLQSNPTQDYPKFPVETAFRTMGDCEDQAMLDAAYLTSCGFVTAMALIHDANNPNFSGGLYHGTLLVHISDTTAFTARYPDCPLWHLGYGIDPYSGYTWCWLDPTWDTPFGSVPAWLPYYYGGISSSQVSIAVCTVNGGVATASLGSLSSSP